MCISFIYRLSTRLLYINHAVHTQRASKDCGQHKQYYRLTSILIEWFVFFQTFFFQTFFAFSIMSTKYFVTKMVRSPRNGQHFNENEWKKKNSKQTNQRLYLLSYQMSCCRCRFANWEAQKERRKKKTNEQHLVLSFNTQNCAFDVNNNEIIRNSFLFFFSFLLRNAKCLVL